jgi:hypothetical protein
MARSVVRSDTPDRLRIQPGVAALALDWFEEIRAEANPPQPYVPTPRLTVTDDDVAAMVANHDGAMHEVLTRAYARRGRQDHVRVRRVVLEAEVQKQVASGFWDTITKNADADPAAGGWYRFARPGACKFCVMLAGRGDVYTEAHRSHFASSPGLPLRRGPVVRPECADRGRHAVPRIVRIEAHP